MGWTDPRTWTAGELVTAAIGNAHWRDNLKEVAHTPGTQDVTTSEATTSTTYTDLTTSGPAVTATIGPSGIALVIVSARMSNTGSNTTAMSYAVSGASTVAAADVNAASNDGVAGRSTRMTVQTGLTAGSNTFTAKYRADAGTGTFDSRRIIVIPIG